MKIIKLISLILKGITKSFNNRAFIQEVQFGLKNLNWSEIKLYKNIKYHQISRKIRLLEEE